MSGGEAAAILEHLSAYPQLEDVVDVQLARIIQIVGGIGGSSHKLEEVRLRGRERTEEEIAEDWIRWIDERQNRITH